LSTSSRMCFSPLVSKEHNIFFELLQYAVKNKSSLPEEYCSPDRLFNISHEQGVSVMLFETVREYLGEERFPDEVALPWFSLRKKSEIFARKQRQAVIDLAEKLSLEGVRLMLMKGPATALLYPEPLYRESGDIDIYCFGDYEKVNEIASANGCPVSEEDSKHSSFTFNDITVENHRALNYPELNKANEVMAKRMLEEFNKEPVTCAEMPGVFLPSPTARAMYLMMHSLTHLAWSGIPVRNLLDWSLLIRRHSNEIDWKKVHDTFKEAGLLRPVAIINSICRDYLGADISSLGSAFASDIESYAKGQNLEDVLSAILSPQQSSSSMKSPLKKLQVRIKRYNTRCKLHKIIYGEPMPDGFFKGVVGKSIFEFI